MSTKVYAYQRGRVPIKGRRVPIKGRILTLDIILELDEGW